MEEVLTVEDVQELLDLVKKGHEVPNDILQALLESMSLRLEELEAAQQVAALACLEIDKLMKLASSEVNKELLPQLIQESHKGKEAFLSNEVERKQRYLAALILFRTKAMSNQTPTLHH